ncbi:hypothetical protein IEQ44_12640 [Nocardioides sp. Y6]|uniref:DUF3558 domain-containing protein n=1 Tax=Nocardioides malaquae TaxID=2773426 RepID=A0ABR9RVB6_9ACTN|nr:hypothetical protein [Nocardioides malaquae]MBE7325499.1 hypothetical protein [Nocardioides malaquae]
MSARRVGKSALFAPLLVLAMSCSSPPENRAESGPLEFYMGAGGSAINAQDTPTWWGTVGLPLCSTEPVTIERVEVVWSGGILAQEEWLYASPRGSREDGTHRRFGAGPGKPPTIHGMDDMDEWVEPAQGTRVEALPCDVDERAGRFADLLVAGRTDDRGAKVERVSILYTTGDGQSHSASTSRWQITLCGTEMLQDPDDGCS